MRIRIFQQENRSVGETGISLLPVSDPRPRPKSNPWLPDIPARLPASR